MPLHIIRNDITRMETDAIVNTANPHPIAGPGTDAAIHYAAGPALLEARKQIGEIAPGCSRLTEGYLLPAKYVIHTVGGYWQADKPVASMQLLRRCYDSALALAEEHGCRSIAFPLMAAGSYRYPRDIALNIANEAFADFLAGHDMDIWLVLYDSRATRIASELGYYLQGAVPVEAESDNSGFEAAELCYSVCPEEPLPLPSAALRPDLPKEPKLSILHREKRKAIRPRKEAPDEALPAGKAAPKAVPVPPVLQTNRCFVSEAAPAVPEMELGEYLNHIDENFPQMVFRKIDEMGIKDAECYTHANLSKAAFAKIRKAMFAGEPYTPKRETAYALAIALRLDLKETRELLSKAGYAMTSSIKLDLAMQYFISRGIYNILEINMELYEHDLPMLGSV